MQAEEVDPRLVALGLVPPPAQAPASDAQPATAEPPPPPKAPPAEEPPAHRAWPSAPEPEQPIDAAAQREARWLEKLRRAAAAAPASTPAPRARVESAPQPEAQIDDARLEALTAIPAAATSASKAKPQKVKTAKVKAPKEAKVKPPKEPKIKVAKVKEPKPPKVETAKVETPKVERAKPAPVARPVFVPDPNAKLVFAHTVSFGLRAIPLELWSDRVSIGKRHVPWDQVRAVTVRAGHVFIDTGDKKTSLAFIPAVDGVPDPTLAPLFAEIVLDGSAGAPPRDKLVRALSDGRADTKYRFRERDDQSLPVLVLLITGLAAALLAVIVPIVIAIPFRSGAAGGADTFLVYPRLSPLDPRALAAAIAGGMILSRLAMRAAAGPDLMLWAHGTAAGWNRAAKFRGRLAKVLASHMLLHTRAFAYAIAIALVLFLPSARERVLVDVDGIHVRAGLPFFDRDVPWSNVAKPTLIDQGGTYDVVLSTGDGALVFGTLLDTRGALFYGLSPYELAQFAERQRTAPR